MLNIYSLDDGGILKNYIGIVYYMSGKYGTSASNQYESIWSHLLSCIRWWGLYLYFWKLGKYCCFFWIVLGVHTKYNMISRETILWILIALSWNLVWVMIRLIYVGVVVIHMIYAA